jgi:hypothetical protein
VRRVRGGERRCGLATDGRRSITRMSAFRILRIEFFHENLTEHELDASEVNLGTNINTHSTIALEADCSRAPTGVAGFPCAKKLKLRF